MKRQQEAEWRCRICPVVKRSLCGALMRGASQLPNGHPCPVRQTSYSAAANEVIHKPDQADADRASEMTDFAVARVTAVSHRRSAIIVAIIRVVPSFSPWACA